LILPLVLGSGVWNGELVKGNWVGTLFNCGFLKCIYVVTSHFHV
jgi:hypothetical protein